MGAPQVRDQGREEARRTLVLLIMDFINVPFLLIASPGDNYRLT